MKRIIGRIKKIMQWFNNKPILATEVLVIILTMVLISTSYFRYKELVCSAEQLHYGYLGGERWNWRFDLLSAGSAEEAEKVFNDKVLICLENEGDIKNNELPYGICFDRCKDGKLIYESDESSTAYHYDSKALELAKNADQRSRYRGDYIHFVSSGIIPERYYLITDMYEVTGEESEGTIYFRICIDITKYILNYTPFVAESIAGIVILQLAGVLIIILKKRKKVSKSELDEAKDLFVNAMAHEMKTPTAIIINSTECIREGIRPDKKEIYRNNISKEAEHINKLVDGMLTYTKVIDDNYRPDKKEIIVNDIARTVLNRFEVLAEKKKLEMTLVENGKMIIEGDARLINTVVDNYISNATKHCRESGKLTVTINDNSFTVFNEGEHIAENELSKIWDPLYKVDKARKISGDSSGMGLAICAGILKLHNLEYGARNVEGGVEFAFTKNI